MLQPGAAIGQGPTQVDGHRHQTRPPPPRRQTCYDQSARPPVPTSPCRPAAKQGCDRLDEQGAPAAGPVPATRPDLRPPFPRGVHPPTAGCANPGPPFRLHHRPRRQPALPGHLFAGSEPASRCRSSCSPSLPSARQPHRHPLMYGRPDKASAHPAQRITPASTSLPGSAEQSRPARRRRPSITQPAGIGGYGS